MTLGAPLLSPRGMQRISPNTPAWLLVVIGTSKRAPGGVANTPQNDRQFWAFMELHIIRLFCHQVSCCRNVTSQLLAGIIDVVVNQGSDISINSINVRPPLSCWPRRNPRTYSHFDMQSSAARCLLYGPSHACKYEYASHM